MRSKTAPLLLLMPILLLYGVLIGGGLLHTFVESLGYIPAVGLHEISFSAYRLNLGDSFAGSMLFSIAIAFVSSSLSTILGFLIACVMTNSGHHPIRTLTQRMLQVGVILPYLYVIFMATTFFGQSGMISRVFHLLNITTEPKDFPRLILDPAGIGMILVFVLKGTPFVALFSFNILSHVSSRYGHVARTLGASGLTILKRIYLPLCSSGLVWSSSVLFAYNLGSFEVPYLMGSLRPVTLSAKLYSSFISPDIRDIPQTMAANILLLALGLVALTLYAMLVRRLTAGRRR